MLYYKQPALMPKKIIYKFMFKKIHFGFSFLVISILSIIPATLYIFIFLNSMGANEAIAVGGSSFGGKITKISECILDTPQIAPTTCASSCPLCTGIMGSACSGATEIMFTPAGGTWNFVCPSKGFLYKGGRPRPGGLIMGVGIAQSLPLQIGVSR